MCNITSHPNIVAHFYIPVFVGFIYCLLSEITSDIPIFHQPTFQQSSLYGMLLNRFSSVTDYLQHCQSIWVRGKMRGHGVQSVTTGELWDKSAGGLPKCKLLLMLTLTLALLT